jgi:hypothetical protein
MERQARAVPSSRSVSTFASVALGPAPINAHPGTAQPALPADALNRPKTGCMSHWRPAGRISVEATRIDALTGTG